MNRNRFAAYADRGYILLAAIFYGLITVAGKYFSDLGFSLYEISLLIMFMPVALLPALLFRKDLRPQPRLFAFYVSFGLIGAGLQLTQFAGIVLGVPVAVVALLLYTQPIWTTVLGRLLLHEAITRRKIISAGLALIGVVFLVEPFSGHVTLNATGVLFAIAAGIFLSLWVIWGRKGGLRGQHFVTSAFGYAFFSSVCLLALYPLARWLFHEEAFVRLDFRNYLLHWRAVAGFTLFAGLTPACLAFSGMRTVEASTAGILLLLEPVSAAILAYLIFAQKPTSMIWIGGGFILFANYVLLQERNSG